MPLLPFLGVFLVAAFFSLLFIFVLCLAVAILPPPAFSFYCWLDRHGLFGNNEDGPGWAVLAKTYWSEPERKPIVRAWKYDDDTQQRFVHTRGENPDGKQQGRVGDLAMGPGYAVWINIDGKCQWRRVQDAQGQRSWTDFTNWPKQIQPKPSSP